MTLSTTCAHADHFLCARWWTTPCYTRPIRDQWRTIFVVPSTRAHDRACDCAEEEGSVVLWCLSCGRAFVHLATPTAGGRLQQEASVAVMRQVLHDLTCVPRVCSSCCWRGLCFMRKAQHPRHCKTISLVTYCRARRGAMVNV